MLGMALWWVIGLAVLIAVVWFLFLASTSSSQRDDTPEAILKRRYAAGEISSEEYERRLSDLRK